MKRKVCNLYDCIFLGKNAMNNNYFSHICFDVRVWVGVRMK